MILTIQTPPLEQQHERNLQALDRHWEDPHLKDFPGKIEGDENGNAITRAAPAPHHAELQGEIIFLLRAALGPKAFPECGVSTSMGYKVPDAAWCSPGRFARAHHSTPKKLSGLLLEAPEICVEILSPSNSVNGMTIKRALYFEAGADEVWLCHEDGRMAFYLRDQTEPLAQSRKCPDFPARVEV